MIVSRPLVPRLDYIIPDPAPMSTAFSKNISYNILSPPGGAIMTVIRSGACALVQPLHISYNIQTTDPQWSATWRGRLVRWTVTPWAVRPWRPHRSARERLAGPLPGWASWPGTYKRKKRIKTIDTAARDRTIYTKAVNFLKQQMRGKKSCARW